MIDSAGNAFALWLVWRCWRRTRAQRQYDRLQRYVERLHSRPATLEETMATFWLGAFLIRYGSDKQLDEWYSIIHGTVPPR